MLAASPMPPLFSRRGHSANCDGVLRCRKSFSQKGDERGSEDSSCPQISDSKKGIQHFYFVSETAFQVMLAATPSLFSRRGLSANGDGVSRRRKSLLQKRDKRDSEDTLDPQIRDSKRG
ncbi:hypothetical protein CDAR_167321 [Caerostris darwini]|uniref:Uncharacterized protein n=1 Tax=Caerostris darwini TaxID=1538125 RepID=A0AAV4TKY1_9ARAC|nr:hypothetical protein CDAR_167321 [Caerostris darwini]